ncbi:MAG TPA: asparagine synthase (glutamine-hydrolyzing) [Burkholderiales bacterium]|nr:asparagine synthase (glutamine-hydrolyzing) [Burkholderiales bacterium]
MCGIAGWLARKSTLSGPDTLKRMTDAIAHRGPDDEGMYFEDTADGVRGVALGHRRLAIIDLAGGHQPMRDAAAGLTLTFNGEIYNFREIRAELIEAGYSFQHDSDTEVLLRAYQHWGCDLVHHLRGMFAFALWDAKAQRLVLARDRFGEKPLFIHQDADGIYFASEVKALLALPSLTAKVDMEGVWDYLAYRYVPAPRTLFAGIRKLLPGTIAVWENGALSEGRYYAPPDCMPPASGPLPHDVTAAFLEKLDAAVRIEMVSDVPFGAFLSGGLDSSAIVALMTRHSGFPVMTYSVGFSESAYSELSYAAEVARLFNTNHHELVVSHRHVIDRLAELVHFRDAPVSEPSDVPIYLLAKEARRTVKMVLTGEGSDEVLAGYPKHVAENFVRPYQALPVPLRRNLIEPLAHALPYRFRRVKTAITNLSLPDAQDRYVRWFGALSRVEREELAGLGLSGQRQLPCRNFAVNADNSTLRNILCFDQSSWLPDNLLERGDRMTMAASLEARVPFLDDELVAFVSSLPDRYRVRGLHTKWVLRDALRHLVPARILNRPKVGFRVPVNEWLRTTMREYLLSHLQSGSSLTREYYNPQTLHRVIREHLDGRQNHEKLLWSLLNLEIWHRIYL